MRRALVTALAMLSLPGCSGDETTPPPLPELPRLEDGNPDPGVVEVSLRAQLATKKYPGSAPSKVWTYEGSVPGPLLEARVGDELRVHFENDLPEGTTIHWHGVRLPAAMDGSMAMQSAVQPGAGFDYSFVLKDAGLFWYHPHVRSDVQVEKGLYGALLVRGEHEPAVDGETILVLDDVRVGADGSFPEYLDDESKMMGREGNLLLVNGAVGPELTLRRGALERLRLVNAANGRFFDLRLEGHGFRVIGTDGGLVPAPWDAPSLLIAPGERYDVVLIPNGEPGQVFTLWNEPYARGHDSGHAEPMPVARVRLSNAPALAGRALPVAFPAIEALPSAAADIPVALGEAFDAKGALVFTINGKTYPEVPPVAVASGSVHVLGLRNDSDMDHPFHLHGFFFQRLGAPLVNKDTIIVRAHEAFDLAARFDEPGMWMYHCHILEHAEGGMAGELHVE